MRCFKSLIEPYQYLSNEMQSEIFKGIRSRVRRCTTHILTAECESTVTPLLTQWSHCSPALSHRYSESTTTMKRGYEYLHQLATCKYAFNHSTHMSSKRSWGSYVALNVWPFGFILFFFFFIFATCLKHHFGANNCNLAVASKQRTMWTFGLENLHLINAPNKDSTLWFYILKPSIKISMAWFKTFNRSIANTLELLQSSTKPPIWQD